MKRFYIHITASHWIAKNNLQSEFQKLMHSQDHRIFDSNAQLKLWMKFIQHSIKELNEKHSRCKPLELTTVNDEIAGCPGVVLFGIFEENTKHLN